MPYLDEAGYAERFTQRELTQLQATGGGLEFDRAVADASETVDSYLAAIPGRTFTLPLTVPPARIVGITADLARYELWAQRASDEVSRRRDQAIEYLKDLVAGRAVLSVTAETPPGEGADPGKRVGYRAKCRTYTDRTLSGFVEPACCDPAEGLRGCD